MRTERDALNQEHTRPNMTLPMGELLRVQYVWGATDRWTTWIRYNFRNCEVRYSTYIIVHSFSCGDTKSQKVERRFGKQSSIGGGIHI